jgi:8-amino-7-oxononanoate synthase
VTPEGELDRELAAEMARWESAGLKRELGRGRAGARDFTSNDYLGLSRHPDVIAAAVRAIERFGAGGRASRLLGGGTPVDDELEGQVADWLGSEAALLFPSGYQANLGLIGALAGPRDVIVSDESCHASLIDAARLSRARVRLHRHLDLEQLEGRLRESRRARRRLVLTEGVFSMDGDAPDLATLHGLCERYDAWLVLDEAHSAGLTGPAGAGAWSGLGRDVGAPSRLAARVVTGGKALGVAGAIVAGSRALREHLVNRARSFMFTTAVTPGLTGALGAAIEICRATPQLREHARALARELAQSLDLPEPAGAIVPVVLGDERAALAAATDLRERGFEVRCVRPPTVRPGGAALRVVCHAFNGESELAGLLEALAPWAKKRSPPLPKAALAPALFVAGTDTGVGKTVVAALLVRASKGRYWKPVQTGPESDSAVVRLLAALDEEHVTPPAHELALPASPDQAAAAEGREIDSDALSASLQAMRLQPTDRLHTVELAGGLLVPLGDTATQLDWLARERLPIVLVARSGLGTLNHTLLSLEALRARQLEPRALFLVGPPHPRNRATLERWSEMTAIHELPVLDPLDTAALDRWLEHTDIADVIAR